MPLDMPGRRPERPAESAEPVGRGRPLPFDQYSQQIIAPHLFARDPLGPLTALDGLPGSAGGDAGPAVGYCDRCGAPAGHDGSAACARARALEPPRYCPACRRRLVVQVTPTGWTARCAEHGITTA